MTKGTIGKFCRNSIAVVWWIAKEKQGISLRHVILLFGDGKGLPGRYSGITNRRTRLKVSPVVIWI
ncbi:hypothetical protein I7I50_04913 [Histoplasma capsulatum G186AR]|uniref:Uncharacterized protein n=1 Tax=Ajellomyces capsulatus TaxID=5037 RepID=A0A8H7Z8Z4_AJECA|nr:hypothetical protein I7I52_03171 [Histoplasma capsulatum]QSS75695.1 hypothetical protein I7I50_04913 [Histoplasma capsulatum G186AR]